MVVHHGFSSSHKFFDPGANTKIEKNPKFQIPDPQHQVLGAQPLAAGLAWMVSMLRASLAGESDRQGEKCALALVLVDVINDMDFEPRDAGRRLCRNFEPVAKRLVGFKERCRREGVPTIYVNDNFGRWRSDFKAVVEHCCEQGRCGAGVSRLLRPEEGSAGEGDYFVLKPRHSGFFHTSLELLLEHLGARTLIVTGVAGNNCVLFTANDAYLRGYKVVVPEDGLADEDETDTARALEQMRKVLKADTTRLGELDLAALQARGE